MTFRAFRLFLVIAAALAAAGLSACGRRGPLELPPDVQARGAVLNAEQAARAKTATKPAPGAPDEKPEATGIPGTIGNRPPAQYPFPLDPLL